MHPHGFALDAVNYAKAAALTFGDRPDLPLPYGFVPYDLSSHSIELALKAFLMLHGLTIERLRARFGHDLRKLLRKAKSVGLDGRFGDIAKLTAFVDHLDAPHRERRLGYPTVQFLTLPEGKALVASVLGLAEAVQRDCSARLLAEIRQRTEGAT